MRIGVDMLAAQSAGCSRGTGRYIRALLPELLHASSHECFLYYHGGLAQQAPHEYANERVLPAEASLHLGVERLLRTNADNLDVLLLSCPLENFEGYLPPFPRRGRARLAAIVYDLIPLRFPQHYLRHPAIADAYRRALAAVRQYDLLLTISESSRQEVIRALRVPEARVVTIGAGSDADCFYPSPSRSVESDRHLSQLGIHKPYLYALTALDYRKNFAGLLAALEQLSPSVLDGHQFVITCASAGDDELRQARDAIDRSPVAPCVVLTGKVNDEQLRTLYQHALAFVFPSRYEGFGLPLVEAMQCGAPVVGGRNSSQIEVVGDAGLLADVDDSTDLANTISRVLTDRQLAMQLRSRGIERARQFTWSAVADRCARALESMAEQPRRSTWFGTLTARGTLFVAARRKDRNVPHVMRTTA
ncbi:MAG TPA: glycosyltransferase family 1 protein [Pirellulales bacterium]|nr:glycosyltransferase family 1 protein [Pirellulales bacterium]